MDTSAIDITKTLASSDADKARGTSVVGTKTETIVAKDTVVQLTLRAILHTGDHVAWWIWCQSKQRSTVKVLHHLPMLSGQPTLVQSHAKQELMRISKTNSFISLIFSTGTRVASLGWERFVPQLQACFQIKWPIDTQAANYDSFLFILSFIGTIFINICMSQQSKERKKRRIQRQGERGVNC